ncbi:MAG: Uma2 family endonuclease [Eubacterium sp.]|nr:Uma2 family endonuclease [Eubacterium sp.]
MTAVPAEKKYTIQDIEALSDDKHAELIGGEIYMMAPPSRLHQEIVSEVLTAINNHIRSNNGKCRAYPAPFAVRLFADDSTYLEPDISVICDNEKLTDKGCSGAPDWVIEVVSPESVERDYYRKLMLYQSAGVREYWIINPMERKVNVYFFPEFQTYEFSNDIPVRIYPGFSIRITELMYNN